MSKNIKIFKMKDSNEKYYKSKGDLFDMSFRLLIIGKSFLSGKGNFIGNLLLQEDKRLYRNEFEGDNIYIFSGSLDSKMKTVISELEIPKNNVFNTFDEEVLDALYELIREEFEEAVENKERPKHSLIIFDDMSFGGHLKSSMNGAISKIFCNGRHILLSCILTAQKATDILTVCQENASGLVLFSCSDRQLDYLTDYHNYIGDKKLFKKTFRKVTNQPHSYMVINYSNPFEKRYLDKDFLPIKF